MEKRIMDPEVAVDKLRNLCSRQEKCPTDIFVLLKRWEVQPQYHDQILQSLLSDKFVDEERYAAAFVRDKIKFDHWGLIKIRMILRQKGIDSKVAESVISSIDKTAYQNMIRTELEKKRKTLSGNPYEIWAKLARYGSSRGYTMDEMEPFLEK